MFFYGHRQGGLMWEESSALSFEFCFLVSASQQEGHSKPRRECGKTSGSLLRVLFTCVRDGSDNFEEGRLFSYSFFIRGSHRMDIPPFFGFCICWSQVLDATTYGGIDR